MGNRVIIIGGGVAGMQAAITLDELGLQPILIEKEAVLGGKLNKWDRLFPTMTPAEEVLTELTKKYRLRTPKYTRQRQSVASTTREKA